MGQLAGALTTLVNGGEVALGGAAVTATGVGALPGLAAEVTAATMILGAATHAVAGVYNMAAGKLAGGARPSAGPTNGDYRGRLNESLRSQGKPELPSEWDAHHRIPQEYRNHPDFKGFDFDAPENLRGVSSYRNGFDVHQEITREWGQFNDSNPFATRAQIEQFADSIDAKYGYTYWP